MNISPRPELGSLAGIPQGLKSVREDLVFPPGLATLFPPFPALKRWAIIGCSLRLRSGQALRGMNLSISFHCIVRNLVLLLAASFGDFATQILVDRHPSAFIDSPLGSRLRYGDS